VEVFGLLNVVAIATAVRDAPLALARDPREENLAPRAGPVCFAALFLRYAVLVDGGGPDGAEERCSRGGVGAKVH
jgi:hypothetical protein